jgi:type II secretory pathway pseudopilin PulG
VKRAGFSLLEILMAGALLTLALTMVLAPLQRARVSSGHAQSRLDALRLAEDLVQQVRLSQRAGSWRGQTDRIVYDVRSSPVETDLTRVDVELRWEDKRLARQTFIYGLRP